MKEQLKIYEEKMDKTIDSLMNDYASIRAGRANPHVLDKIKVDYYGTPQSWKKLGLLASLSSQPGDPRSDRHPPFLQAGRSR